MFKQDYQILLQNENGPCPLLAAANVLLLRQAITLPSNCKAAGVITIEELTNLLAEKILTNHHGTEGSDHHINEVMKIFPNLQYGMDVNPKFTGGPTAVEYTLELNAFDLLSTELVHGWLLDPDAQEHEWVADNSYNQLVNVVIQGNDASAALQKNPRCINHDELASIASKGTIIHHFLERSSSQLTQYGLQVLHEYLNEGKMAIFFRNNHYNTLTKHEGHLFLLVTDFGYADVSSVVWEKLDVIDGDTEYVNGDFKVPPPVEHHASAAATGLQANSDYQLALQLSRESEAGTEATSSKSTEGASTKPKSPPRQSKHDVEMEKAKQASLLEHQQQLGHNGGAVTTTHPVAPAAATETDTKPPPSALKATTASIPPQQTQPSTINIPKDLPPNVAVGIPAPNFSQEDRDRVLAMQLQRQEEQDRQAALEAARAADPSSERLAQAMQQRENERQQQRAARARAPPIASAQRQAVSAQRQQARAGGNDGCIIS
ncbi:MAG: hypothetical protein SGILL_000318 [Bacillariaceae sp.]